MSKETVHIGGEYIFTSLPGIGDDGLDSVVGRYNEKIVTVLREQIEGVDEENRPMYVVKAEDTPEFQVFEEEILYNPIKKEN